MKILYVLNGRMPSRKAYGIQATQTCQALIEQGHEVVMVVPRTRASAHLPLRDYYRLRTDVPTVVLPALDWYDRGRLAFLLSSLSFVLTSSLYILWKRMQGAVDALYTIDTNTFSLALAPYLGVPCFAEIHVTKPKNIFNRLFFRKATGIITLNAKVCDELMHSFGVPRTRFIVEPCGVEASWFDEGVPKQEARERLGIPHDERIAIYVGRLYSWKGLSILPPAMERLTDISCYIVGGTPEEFLTASGVKELPPNIKVMGSCAHDEVPLWQAAADVFIVPWPKHQLPYHEFGSPMKLLECMAARRPLVSADHVTITSVVPHDCAFLYEPSNAESLAAQVKRAFSENTEGMVERAYRAAKHFTLQNRAMRTAAFIAERVR